MKYAYQNQGNELVSWRGMSAPYQSRAADAKALGSLGDSSLTHSSLSHPTLVLPVPGGAEPLNGDCGCGCKGAGTCGGMGHDGLSGIVDTLGTPIVIGVAAYAVYALFIKKTGRRKKHSRAKEMYLRVKHR